MNGFPHLGAAVLLLAVMPMAVAQSPAQEVPPAAAPKALPATSPPATPSPPGSQTRREVDQAVDAIRNYSAGLRDQAVANARRAAEDLDGQMARLQAQTDQRWDRMSQAARTRSQATMADLRQRRNALAEWYGGMRHSSTAAWDEVKAGFVTSYGELANALRRARAEIGQGEKDDAADQPQLDEKR